MKTSGADAPPHIHRDGACIRTSATTATDAYRNAQSTTSRHGFSAATGTTATADAGCTHARRVVTRCGDVRDEGIASLPNADGSTNGSGTTTAAHGNADIDEAAADAARACATPVATTATDGLNQQACGAHATGVDGDGFSTGWGIHSGCAADTTGCAVASNGNTDGASGAGISSVATATANALNDDAWRVILKRRY